LKIEGAQLDGVIKAIDYLLNVNQGYRVSLGKKVLVIGRGFVATVVGIRETKSGWQSNRYGRYHMSGNVTKWTQSRHLPFNKIRPYNDHERARQDPELAGLRVARGGSWYSASTALLSLAYREAFQPEHSSQEIGFRIIARSLP